MGIGEESRFFGEVRQIEREMKDQMRGNEKTVTLL